MAFVDCLEDPLHRQMYAYWQQKRGSRRMPGRTDIDPTEIPRLLPNLLISEYVAKGDAGRWRYRLAGTAVAAAFGRNPTGRFVEELTRGDYRAFIERIHGLVRDEQRALFCASEYTAAISSCRRRGSCCRSPPTGGKSTRSSPCSCSGWAPACRR